MSQERLSQHNLLEKAAENKIRKEKERISIEEAKEKIPELTDKIMDILGLTPPRVEKRDSLTPEELQDWLKNLGERIKEINIGNMFDATLQTFSVPVGKEKIEVLLIKGRRSSGFASYIDKGLEVNVKMLDSLLRIDRGCAVIESKAHNHKPFDMHTPIGPGGNSDLGPVWSREMNMDDFNSYNQLLDRIVQPDVVKVERKNRNQA